MALQDSISRAASHLLSFQREDGHFEGNLSANTFPSCAYALIQTAIGRSIDQDLVEWFVRNQNDQGYWGLDASGGSDREATLFAKIALREMDRAINSGVPTSVGGVCSASIRNKIESSLAKSPELTLNLWIVKIMYARRGYIPWEEVMTPGVMRAAMRLMEWLKPLLPKSLLNRLKPPIKFAPPVRMFYSPIFQELFVAEKYTLVPLLLIIEAHTGKRKDVIAELADWLLKNRCIDGSWFRVGLITAISLLALIDVRAFFQDELELAINQGLEWLQHLRTSDGGCREAINLNVWDTALSVISLKSIGVEYGREIAQAAEWLLENQNEDGGWPFSGLPGGNLPSDADDTALATLALLKAGVSKDHGAIQKSIKWLREHQAEDGGWGTYIPGTGDVSCVSITSHVIEACLEMGELREEIKKAVDWIKKSISNSGYWDDLWLVKNTYGTALALTALVKSGHPDCVELQRGVRWFEENQASDGGWGEDMEGHKTDSTIEQTAWSTYALLLAGRNASAWKGIEYLLNHQKADGSWPSSCVGIYWEVIGGYVDPVYPSVFSLMALSQAGSL